MLEPDEQVQVVAPLGVNVNDRPEQIDPELIARIGVALTVTDDTTPVVFTQPDALVPVTV